MIIKSFYDIDNFDLIKNYDKNKRDIRLYNFKEVIITGISQFYPNILLKQLSDNYLILPTKEMTMSLNKKSYYEENNMNFDYIESVKIESEETEETVETVSDKVESVEAESVEAESVEVESVEAESVEAESVEAESVEVESVKTETVEAKLVKIESIKTESEETEETVSDKVELVEVESEKKDIDSVTLGNKNIILDPVYFFIYNTENYFHFIYDTLPYLYSFLQLRKTNPKIKLLMNFINKNKNDFIPFVIEALELLHITRDDIIIHNTNNIYNQLYLSSSLTHNGLSNLPPRKEIFEIYDLMIKNARLKYNNNDNNINLKKIYISRRTWTNKSNLNNIGTNYTNRRKLMNEDELVEKLVNLNFNEVFGENYTFLEKVILFNNSEEVIGSIGGTIVNCVFCNKNCKITCLVSPDFLRVNKRIKFSLINKNIKYFEDTYLDTENDKIPQNVRIEIINGEFKGFLGEIVKYENENKYLINLGDERNIGWNNDEDYKKIILNKEDFKQLDYGLNSPWYIDIYKFLISKTAIIFYGLIEKNIDRLIEKLKYYSKFIKNIILITFEYYVKNHLDSLKKIINEENLFLIPSNKNGENLNNKELITPFTITQPNNHFFYDSSYYKISYKANEKGPYSRFCIYKYFQTNKKKYYYYLLLRNDICISLNKKILNNFINKSNKIVLNSLYNYEKCLTEEQMNVCMDKNRNFILVHPNSYTSKINLKKLIFDCFYGGVSLMFGKYENIYDFINIVVNNTKHYPHFWPNGENYLLGQYIFVKEGINKSLNWENNEELFNKYFNFEKNICIYFNRDFTVKRKNYNQGSTFPCAYCKKNNIFDEKGCNF